MLLSNNKAFEEAMNVAKEYDVSTPKDCVVLFSISFLLAKKNKKDALEYIEKNPNKLLIDHTQCGRKLIELGLDNGTSELSGDDARKVWMVASKRFIEQASGDIVAFVKGADPRSVFCFIELPAILQNPNIKNINGIDKFLFSKNFEK